MPITSAAYCRPRLWTSREGGLIKCWEEKTGTCVKILDGHGAVMGDGPSVLPVASLPPELRSRRRSDVLVRQGQGGAARGADDAAVLYGVRRAQQSARRGRTRRGASSLRAVRAFEQFVDDDAGARADAAVVHLSVRDAHDDIVRAIRCDALGSGAFYTAGYDAATRRSIPRRSTPAPPTKLHVRGKPRFRRFPNLHDAPIVSLDFDQDNGWIVTGSLDGTVRVFTRGRGDSTRSNPTGIARVLSARLPRRLRVPLRRRGRRRRRNPRRHLVFRRSDAVGTHGTRRGRVRVRDVPAPRLTPSEHDPDGRRGFDRRARDPRERYDAVVWRFNLDASFRVHAEAHEDWIEALCAVPQPPGAPEVVYSAAGTRG